MKASLLNFPLKATFGADPKAALLEAKSIAARLHVNVLLDLGSATKLVHATSDVDALAAEYEKSLALEGMRT